MIIDATTILTAFGITGITSFIGVAAKLWPVIRKFSDLADDMLGEEGRPGVPARPGVMVRLATIEQSIAVQQPEIAELSALVNDNRDKLRVLEVIVNDCIQERKAS